MWKLHNVELKYSRSKLSIYIVEWVLTIIILLSGLIIHKERKTCHNFQVTFLFVSKLVVRERSCIVKYFWYTHYVSGLHLSQIKILHLYLIYLKFKLWEKTSQHHCMLSICTHSVSFYDVNESLEKLCYRAPRNLQYSHVPDGNWSNELFIHVW